MWGAPSSGKTTFLAALSLALNRRGGDWNLAGANEASEKILIRLTAALTRGHAFPDATEAIEQYNWVLNGQVRPGKMRRFRRDKEQIVKPVRVSLDLVGRVRRDHGSGTARLFSTPRPHRAPGPLRRDRLHVRPDQGIRQRRRL